MLRTIALSCERGRQQLWRDINLSLTGSQALLVKGDNGSGKSSFLRMLAGLLTPTSGQVLWNGESITKNRYSFQEELLYVGHLAPLKPELNALENLQYLMNLRAIQVSQTDLINALNRWQMHGKTILRPIKQLSQGQKQRVCLAQLSLSHQPLWILDEPFNSLDAMGSLVLGTYLQDHLKSQRSLVLTSHLHANLDAIKVGLSNFETVLQFS